MALRQPKPFGMFVHDEDVPVAVATPEQAQDALAFIRSLVADRDAEQAEQLRILYGGSMKPDNAAELLGLPDCDGGLIGGAALDPVDFAAIVDSAKG